MDLVLETPTWRRHLTPKKLWRLCAGPGRVWGLGFSLFTAQLVASLVLSVARRMHASVGRRSAGEDVV